MLITGYFKGNDHPKNKVHIKSKTTKNCQAKNDAKYYNNALVTAQAL